MAKMYYRIGLTGGGSNDLDGIDGATLADKDGAIAFDSGYFYFYSLDVDSGSSESSPDVISPDINPGDKRWVLQTITSAQDIDDVPTFQGLTVEKDAKIKQDLEVLQTLVVGGEVSLEAALTIAGLLTVNNDVEVNGNVNAEGFTINGDPVGTSTDTYWNSNSDGDIYYRSGNILGNPIDLNKYTITQNWTIPSGYHGCSVGPLDIEADVTIAKDSVWEVL